MVPARKTSATPADEDRPYEIAFKESYVEIRQLQSFKVTKPLAQAIWHEAVALCKTHNCHTILRSGPAPVRDMSPEQLQSGAASLDLPGLKVAWCWHDYRPDPIDAAFATHAMANGVTVRHFCSAEEAVRWLAESS